MLIGKKGYYFIKVILIFAFSENKSFSIREVSKRLGISEKVLEQVLLHLKHEGLLASKRGPNGGYWLAKDVSNMTLKDILKITSQKVNILPDDVVKKGELIDEVLNDAGDDIRNNVYGKLELLTVKKLVERMRGKVTEKGLVYNI